MNGAHLSALLLVCVNGDTALLHGKAKRDIASVRRGVRIRNRDGNKDVIVPSVSRDGVNARSGRQVVDKHAGFRIDDAEQGIAAEGA